MLMIMRTEIHGIVVDVEYEFYKGCRGARGRFREPLEPDEPPAVVIQSVTDLNGQELYDILSNRILSQLDLECMADYYDHKEDCYE